MRDLFTAVGVIGAILVLAITLTVIANGQPQQKERVLESKVVFCKDYRGKVIIAFRVNTAMHMIAEDAVTAFYMSRADETTAIIAGGREIRTSLKPNDFWDARLKFAEQDKAGTVPLLVELPMVKDFFED